MDRLNLISVCETSTGELIATGARMIVRITGHSFFTGSEALTSAAEVAACIDSLEECGIPAEDVRLLNVAAEVESGFLTKSSWVNYELEVNCRSIGLLSPAITAVASQKNSKILFVVWDYPDLQRTKKEVLQDAVRTAHSSAAAIADALNTSVLGVHKLSYDVDGLDNSLRLHERAGLGRAANEFATRSLKSSSGVTFSHTTEILVTVKADFLVGIPSGST